jgi:hypothetical protein
MSDQALSHKLELMMARMAAMQAEINTQRHEISRLNSSLRLSAAEAPVDATPANPNPTRRRMLRRLAGGMLAGLAIGGAAAAIPENAQARLVADPTSIDNSRRVGAIIVPPGTDTLGGIPAGGPTVKYGLVATDGYNSTFKLSNLPGVSAGVFGNGYIGVFGDGVDSGVYGIGFTNGVYGDGYYGVHGNGG